MRVSALEMLRCPKCGGALELRPTQGASASDEVQEGALFCSGCGMTFRISASIPRFVPGDEYAASFGFQWNKFRRTQLDSYTGMSLSSDRLFRVTGWLRSLTGQTILEAGSGAGRFTEVLAKTGATVFSFDLSDAIDANFQNNGTAPRLNLFQASIYELPFQPESFDKVLCLGVLQHTPDPHRSFECLARLVKPGGEIAIDVYAKRLQSVVSWKYLLRPFTTRMPKDLLFSTVERTVDALLPMAISVRRVAGRWGAKLFPIVEYSHWGLPFKLNREWSMLDSFDMYSPAYDHPCSRATVARWFKDLGFADVTVEYGPNGVIARGRKPGRQTQAASATQRRPGYATKSEIGG